MEPVGGASTVEEAREFYRARLAALFRAGRHEMPSVRASASSTVRIGAGVDLDRFDSGAFGGRPPRGRDHGAKPARVLNFPGGAALEGTVKSERLFRVQGDAGALGVGGVA